MAEPILEVIDLQKEFIGSRKKRIRAVNNVSFTINEGETLGVVGESGCGKTTVGRTIVRLYDADGGKVLYRGLDIHKADRRTTRKLAKQIQMVFQDPYSSLDPRKTVLSILEEGLKIHKLFRTKKERIERVYQLLELVGLNREHANRFPHEFSGGQRQRIGIARALSVNPELIVCDEAISALDVSIQAQIINLLIDLQDRLKLTYLFIAHDIHMVRYISDHIAVMYLGTLVEKASTEQLFKNPLHPYTRGLLEAIPVPDPKHEQQQSTLKGEAKPLTIEHEGCRFYNRCPFAKEICRDSMPALKAHDSGQTVACHMVHSENW
ncbi:oligopeptide transport system ATP-binding protein [Amphibacillus marinus]|uniref:Oligopeptide transport system ATP-binding protein n=1 Tax=Amphibacillus marinus TaxID=872970 RepID=A0A1H8M5V3_9BACI|nr:ABC transporter ATP-binding protein [Amphibacillus marinus]SEO12715.1 oligopeptide transport system ATP-binding protein [Amphibacillus marinus]